MHCDVDDPEPTPAAAKSYDVLRDVARGLDWTPMTGAGGPAATEAMLWSLVHGYAQMRLVGAKAEGGDVPEIIEIVPSMSHPTFD